MDEPTDGPRAVDPHDLAADGQDVLPGVDAPSLDEQLAHLHAAGWPPQ